MKMPTILKFLTCLSLLTLGLFTQEAIPEEITITMNIQGNLDIELVGLNTWDIGLMDVSETATMAPGEEILLRNRSGVLVDFGLKVIPPSGWIPVSAVVYDLNRFSLRTIIKPDSSETPPSYFDPYRDFLTEETKWCDGDIFGGGGTSVGYQQDNYFWFQFAAPMGASSYGSKTFLVIIETRVHLD